MNFQNCIIKLKAFTKQFGFDVADAGLEQMAKHITDQIQAGKMAPEDLKTYLTEAFITNGEYTANAYKNSRLLTLRKFAEASKSLGVKRAGKDLFDNVRDLYEGGAIDAGEGLNLSAEGYVKMHESRFRSAWDSELKRLGVDEAIAVDGILDKEIYRGIALLEKETALTPEVRAANNISETAAKLAEAANTVTRMMFDAKSTFSPGLERAAQYFIKRVHSVDRMIDSGKEVWVSDAMRLFGEKSFGTQTAAQKVVSFGKVYDSITSGKYFGASSPGDISKRLQLERELNINSPDAAAEYAMKYGHGNFLETLDRVMVTNSREIGTAQKFGSIPDEYKRLVSKYVETNATPEELAKFNSTSGREDIDAAWFRATNQGDDIARTLTGKTAEFVRSVNWTSAGGGTGIRAMTDIGSTISTLTTFTGFQKVIGNSVSLVSEFAKNISDTEARNANLKKFYIFAHGGRAMMFDQFGMNAKPVTDGKYAVVMDKMSWLGLQMSKLSGLTRITESLRAAVAAVHANNFAEELAVSWKDASPQFRKEISRYGIGEAEWGILQKSAHAVNEMPFEAKFVTTEGVFKMPDVDIVDYGKKAGLFSREAAPTKPEIDRLRYDLVGKIGAMYTDLGNIATSTPGVRQKAFMYGKSGKDGYGALRRLIWQFRGSSLMNTDTFRRVWSSGEGMSGKLGGVAAMTVMNAGLWAAGDAALNLLRGKTPEEVTPGYTMKVFAGSAAGSIAGDIIFGTLQKENPTTADIASIALGPGIRTLFEPLELGAKYAKGLAEGRPLGKLNEKAVQTMLLDNMPLVSTLPLISGVWNMHVANAIRESLNSGATLRDKERLRKRGQRYWLEDLGF
jgi:hypothetical protein